MDRLLNFEERCALSQDGIYDQKKTFMINVAEAQDLKSVKQEREHVAKHLDMLLNNYSAPSMHDQLVIAIQAVIELTAQGKAPTSTGEWPE